MAKDLRKYQIQPGEDLTGIKPSKEVPYSRPGSYEFFMDVKRNRVEKVRQALERDRFLAHQHNEME